MSDRFIHEFCVVEEPCEIGLHTQVQPFTHIQAHTIIGDNCRIGEHVSIGTGVMIGNRVRIQHSVVLDSGAILEDGVVCGACTVISPIQRMRAQPEAPPSQLSPTLVKAGATIGPNTTIARGVRIGCHTFVEAGSVVDRHVPDYQVVFGNPLTLVGWRCACGSWLSQSPDLPVIRPGQSGIECNTCGKVYCKRSQHRMILLEPLPCDSDFGSDPPNPKPSARY